MKTGKDIFEARKADFMDGFTGKENTNRDFLGGGYNDGAYAKNRGFTQERAEQFFISQQKSQFGEYWK